MNDQLTFWLDVAVHPIPSTIEKMTDGTCRVQLKVDGLLHSTSDEKLPFDADTIKEKIANGEIKLVVVSGSGANLSKHSHAPWG